MLLQRRNRTTSSPRPLGHGAAESIRSIENSTDIIDSRCLAQCLYQLRYCVPHEQNNSEHIWTLCKFAVSCYLCFRFVPLDSVANTCSEDKLQLFHTKLTKA
jgi:hypothetical protein